MLGRWSVAALRSSKRAAQWHRGTRALSRQAITAGKCNPQRCLSATAVPEIPVSFLKSIGWRACSSEAAEAAKDDVPIVPTEEELLGDQHFIEHDLEFPLVVPEDDEALQASVEWIWNKAGKDEGKEIVEAVEAWMEEGRLITRALVDKLIVRLCSRQHYLKAYMLMHWAIRQRHYEITDHDRLVLLHLASMQGKYSKASVILGRLSDKTEFAYERVLRSVTVSGRLTGAESVMKQMKETKIITTPQPYNHMIAMYLRDANYDKAKQYFEELEAAEIAPDALTYKLLVSHKDEIGIEGLEDKAQEFLTKISGKKLKGQEWKDTIGLYASMKQPAGVKKLWEEMSKGKKKFVPDSYYYTAAEAFSIVGDMSKFEELYKTVATRNGKVTAEQCFAMAKAYAGSGLLDKAEVVLETARDNKYEIPFIVFLPLIKAYMNLSREKVADRRMYAEKAADKFQNYLDWRHSTKRDYSRPMFPAVPLLMEAYGATGDVSSAEKLVTMLKTSHKYPMTIELFNSLLRVYARNQTGMYGIQERMKQFRGDPNEETEKYLKRVKPLVAAVVPA